MFVILPITFFSLVYEMVSDVTHKYVARSSAMFIPKAKLKQVWAIN